MTEILPDETGDTCAAFYARAHRFFADHGISISPGAHHAPTDLNCLPGGGNFITSNKTFSAWTEIFGDAVAVSALVDRLVHHAEVIVLPGDSYRLKNHSTDIISNTDL